MTEELLPVSQVAELLYCPRNFYYRVLEGAEDTNVYVTKGKAEEERRDSRRLVQREEYLQTRKVHISSEDLGLSGVLDVVEERDSQIYPVEYKTGTKEWDKLHDAVQLCCQALLLEEDLNTTIEKGYIYYSGSSTRKEVWFDENLRAVTRQTIGEARRIISSGEIPAPVGDARCNGCSLASRCLHEEVNSLQGETKPVRPMPGINMGRTLYVDTYGAYLRKRGDRVAVTKDNDVLAEVPLTDIDYVVVANGVNASVSLLNNLLDKGVSTYFITGSGKVQGWLNPAWNRNILLRRDQFAKSADPCWQLHIAKKFVQGKIANMRTILMRYARNSEDEALTVRIRHLAQVQQKIAEANNLESLRGYEGNAARCYFAVFGRLISEKVPFDFKNRNRRPPRDPVNALLSFAYAMLTKDVTSSITLAGLDPYLGIYHVVHYGRPALSLDLMEEFRPVIADSVVLTVLNKGMITEDEFEPYFNGVQLTEAGRKKFFAAYQQRMAQEVTHPIFGYNLPYRRTIELQARFLAKVIRGELDDYKSFTVR